MLAGTRYAFADGVCCFALVILWSALPRAGTLSRGHNHALPTPTMMNVLLKHYQTHVDGVGWRALQNTSRSVRIREPVRHWLSLDRLLQVSPLQAFIGIQPFEHVRGGNTLSSNKIEAGRHQARKRGCALLRHSTLELSEEYIEVLPRILRSNHSRPQQQQSE